MFIFLLNCFLAFPFFPIKKDKNIYIRETLFIYTKCLKMLNPQKSVDANIEKRWSTKYNLPEIL